MELSIRRAFGMNTPGLKHYSHEEAIAFYKNKNIQGEK